MTRQRVSDEEFSRARRGRESAAQDRAVANAIDSARAATQACEQQLCRSRRSVITVASAVGYACRWGP